MEILVLLIVWIGAAVLSGFVASQKGRGVGAWIVISLLFPLFGLIALAALPSLELSPGWSPVGAQSGPSQSGPAQKIEQMTKKCPECAETIKFEAIVCKHCHYRFDPEQVARQIEQQRPVVPTVDKTASTAAASWSSSPVLVSLALLAAFGVGLPAINSILKRPPRAPAPAATAPATVEARKPADAPTAPATVEARKPADAPTAPAEAPAALAAAPRPDPSVQTDKPAPAASPAQRLVVRAVEATWIRVQTDDGRVAEELLPPGATREWTSNKRFVLTVGNAGGIELELNGRPLAPLGAKGAVIQRLELPEGGS